MVDLERLQAGEAAPAPAVTPWSIDRGGDVFSMAETDSLEDLS